jgi:putative cardiolipin synthase
MPIAVNRNLLQIIAVFTALTLNACVSFTVPAHRCPPGTQQLENCPPPEAVRDEKIEALYRTSAWIKPSKLGLDTIAIGKQAKIPVQSAQTKFIGPRDADALDSLAAKLWMIENAEHTIDLMYYIYSNDLIGKAIMGALCDAVERGVDIRFVVDSIGSIRLKTVDMQALESCQLNAGFMLNENGEMTVAKARVQAVIFNSVTKLGTSPNRRSHDKLLIADGQFADKAAVMIGGRNISLDYYGILADGSPNPETYRDAELLLKNGRMPQETSATVGEVAEIYYTLLFYFKGNKRVRIMAGGDISARFKSRRERFRDSLEELKSIPAVRERLQAMPEYFQSDFHDSDVRLAHEFGNLVNKKVVTNAIENREVNPNSITRLIAEADDSENTLIRIVSPYLFLAKYEDQDSNIVHDEAKRLREWLAENPERRIEIVTNSVLTSDNVGAQAVIDMDTAPGLLMSEEMQGKWLNDPEATEFNAEFMSSEEWSDIANNPQVFIYEVGTLASRLLGGETDYGKLHAKFIITDRWGFVGTSNFDYRSRLFNNEMGFFFSDDDLLADLNRDFEFLALHSYRWGSPDWLEIRRQLREQSGNKARGLKKQRRNYKIMRATGLKWLF